MPNAKENLISAIRQLAHTSEDDTPAIAALFSERELPEIAQGLMDLGRRLMPPSKRPKVKDRDRPADFEALPHQPSTRRTEKAT
jgi:hypothetical protein